MRIHNKLCGSCRRGLLSLESVIALAMLAMTAIFLAQAASWSLQERNRLKAQQDSMEAAANVLEAARATPWAELSPEWAAKQKFSEPLAARWPTGKLIARVEPEPEQPRVKRVTVEVSWDGKPPASLVALFADKSVKGKS